MSYISIIPVVLTHSLDPSEFKVAFVKLTSLKAPLLVNLWHVDVVTKYNNAYLKKKEDEETTVLEKIREFSIYPKYLKFHG